LKLESGDHTQDNQLSSSLKTNRESR